MNWFAFAFIALIGFGCAAAPIKQQLEWRTGQAIVIDVPRGQLVIEGQQQPYLSVSGHIDKQATQFIFSAIDDTLYLQVKLPQHWSRQSSDRAGHSDLTITLPSGAPIQASTVSGDVTVSQVQQLLVSSVSGAVTLQQSHGNFEIESVSGDVTLSQVAGQTTVNCVNGHIVVHEGRGQLNLETISGDIEARISQAHLQLQSVSGDIEISGHQLDAIEGRNVSGNTRVNAVQLADDSHSLLQSVSGDISVAVRKQGNLTVSARSSRGGDIDNRWSPQTASSTPYNGINSLQFGSGSAQLKLGSVSGDITLRD